MLLSVDAMLLWMALVWEAIETPSLTVTMYLPGMGSLAGAITMRDWEDMREQWVGGIDLEGSTAFIVCFTFIIHLPRHRHRPLNAPL